ncbi:MAG: hypothetical protein HRU20_20755 [Pseudomonadales bacterium]|nr:hypothetical protein [Pseudomonadales bacterium]
MDVFNKGLFFMPTGKISNALSLSLILLFIFLGTACSGNDGDEGIYGTGTRPYSQVIVYKFDDTSKKPVCALQDVGAKISLHPDCFSDIGEIYIIEAEIKAGHNARAKNVVHIIYIPGEVKSENIELSPTEFSERVYQYLLYGAQEKGLSHETLLNSLNLLANDMLEEDIDGNGLIDYQDILSMTIETQISISADASPTPEQFFDEHVEILPPLVYSRVAVYKFDDASQTPLCELQDRALNITLPASCFAVAGQMHIIEATPIDQTGIEQFHGIYIPADTLHNVELSVSVISERLFQYIQYGSVERGLDSAQLKLSLDMLASDALDDDIDGNGTIDFEDVLALTPLSNTVISETASSSSSAFFEMHQLLLKPQEYNDIVGSWALISQDMTSKSYDLSVSSTEPKFRSNGVYREICQIIHIIDDEYQTNCMSSKSSKSDFQNIQWINGQLKNPDGSILLKLNNGLWVGQAHPIHESEVSRSTLKNGVLTLPAPTNETATFRYEMHLNTLYATKLSADILSLAEINISHQSQDYMLNADYMSQIYSRHADSHLMRGTRMVDTHDGSYFETWEAMDADFINATPDTYPIAYLVQLPTLWLFYLQNISAQMQAPFHPGLVQSNQLALPIAFNAENTYRPGIQAPPIPADELRGTIDWLF